MTRIVIKGVLPDRAEMVAYLTAHLPTAEWVYDEKRDAMDTFMRSLRHAGDDPCVHMEDDSVLTGGFIDKLEAAISETPSNIIQFFSMRKKDLSVGSRWDRDFGMTQCWYAPYQYSKQIAEWGPGWYAEYKREMGQSGKLVLAPTDTMVNAWLKMRREPYWLHCPSLVDHRIAKSIIDKRRSSKRLSKTFQNPV